MFENTDEVLSVLTRFEILTAIRMSRFVFWVITPYGPVGR
jgi:hypothetical protein